MYFYKTLSTDGKILYVEAQNRPFATLQNNTIEIDEKEYEEILTKFNEHPTDPEYPSDDEEDCILISPNEFMEMVEAIL